MSSFRELQKRCHHLHLKPCAGKGVDRAFLEKLLLEYEETISFYEDQIRRTNPGLYQLIDSFISFLPHPILKKQEDFMV